MPRFIPPHPAKGSSQAKEWAKRMLIARMKKASIRAAGRVTEKVFFGAKGAFAKSGLTKHLPYRQNLSIRCAWCKKKMGEKPPLSDRSVTHTICKDCERIQRAMISTGNPPCKNYNYTKTPRGTPRMRRNPIAVFGLGNPEPVFYQVKCQEPGCPFKLKLGDKKQATMFAQKHANKYRHQVQGMPVASSFYKKNPPRRVCHTVKGKVYKRVKEVRAEKLVHKPGLYKHPFQKGVEMLALDNGDLLLHSTAGKKLWERDR